MHPEYKKCFRFIRYVVQKDVAFSTRRARKKKKKRTRNIQKADEVKMMLSFSATDEFTRPRKTRVTGSDFVLIVRRLFNYASFLLSLSLSLSLPLFPNFSHEFQRTSWCLFSILACSFLSSFFFSFVPRRKLISQINTRLHGCFNHGCFFRFSRGSCLFSKEKPGWRAHWETRVQRVGAFGNGVENWKATKFRR